MKRKIFIITILVMGFFAVQGYAQRERNGRQSSRSEQPRHRSISYRSSGYAAPRRSARFDTYRVNHFTPQRRDRAEGRRHHYGTPQYHRPPVRHHYGYGPPAYRPWRPIFYHHHGFRHYHHHCLFDSWHWYRWGGYHNRFICHSLYHNRFFDSLLGYYIWGTIDAPTRLEIGGIILTKYNNRLKVQNGSSVSYLNLYRSQAVSYSVGNTSIDVTTGGGSALIRFYDDYGNEATYRL